MFFDNFDSLLESEIKPINELRINNVDEDDEDTEDYTQDEYNDADDEDPDVEVDIDDEDEGEIPDDELEDYTADKFEGEDIDANTTEEPNENNEEPTEGDAGAGEVTPADETEPNDVDVDANDDETNINNAEDTVTNNPDAGTGNDDTNADETADEENTNTDGEAEQNVTDEDQAENDAPVDDMTGDTEPTDDAGGVGGDADVDAGVDDLTEEVEGDNPEDAEGGEAESTDVNPEGGEDANMGNDNAEQSDNDPNSLKSLEKDLFADLTPAQLAIKDAELLQNYIDLYDAISTILENVNKIPKTYWNTRAIDFIADKLIELKDNVNMIITTTYSTKTFVENLTTYKQCLLILQQVDTMLKGLVQKTPKS